MAEYEMREIDLINAVAGAVDQSAAAGRELNSALATGQPLDSMTVRAACAQMFPTVVAARIGTIDTSLALADWWTVHAPDPSLVEASATTADLQREAERLDRDRYATCRQEWYAQAERAAAALTDAELTGDTPWQPAGAVQNEMTTLIGPLRSAAQNFAVYVHDRAREQFLGAFEQAARRRQPGIEVRVTEQTVMSDGSIVTTRDNLIPAAETPSSLPRPRHWWRRR